MFFAVFLQGVCNNIIFVILNSIAKDITASSVALVYLANSGPVLVIKLMLPFFVTKVSYNTRFLASSLLFASSLVLISLALFYRMGPPIILTGIALSSAAGGIGEPSMLGLSAVLRNNLVSAFSSGTGLAGVAGYIWSLILKEGFGFTPPWVVGFAIVFPIIYYVNFLFCLYPGLMKEIGKTKSSHRDNLEDEALLSEDNDSEVFAEPVYSSRTSLLLYLMKYISCLFLVYASEYALQSGVWATVGNPVSNRDARDKFYINSNLLYQCGVLLSRSAAIWKQLPFNLMAVLPFVQFAILCFFVLNGVYWFIQANSVLLVICFISGLLGGTVYANSFALIAMDEEIPLKYREFSVAVANVSDTVGILTGDVLGLLLQGCLYGLNNVSDFEFPPVFSCGYEF